jgi:Galactose oxidase, central domain
VSASKGNGGVQTNVHHVLVEPKEWVDQTVVLPYPVSDMTATVVGDIAYIVGGCSGPNNRVQAESFEFFTCSVVTNKTIAFDLVKSTFTDLVDTPAPRYRHAAAYDGNGHLWIMGGRDNTDKVILTVDVLDLQTNTWKSPPFMLPEDVVASDSAAFLGVNGLIYLIGGYLFANYTTSGSVLTIDPVQSLANGTNLVLSSRQGMNEPRGDIQVTAIVNEDR